MLAPDEFDAEDSSYFNSEYSSIRPESQRESTPEPPEYSPNPESQRENTPERWEYSPNLESPIEGTPAEPDSPAEQRDVDPKRTTRMFLRRNVRKTKAKATNAANVEYADALIKKWVQAIVTHMTRSRNTVLRKDVAPWFADVIAKQSEAVTGCFRLVQNKSRLTTPRMPAALAAVFGDLDASVSNQDRCAAIVLFYIRGWLYARSASKSKRDYSLLTGTATTSDSFLETMSYWVQDVNLKLTRHIAKRENNPDDEENEEEDEEEEEEEEEEDPLTAVGFDPIRTNSFQSPLLDDEEPERVAGAEDEYFERSTQTDDDEDEEEPPNARKPRKAQGLAKFRDVRKRLRQNIFVPEKDITQTEVYYPNSVINDIPNCFNPRSEKVFTNSIIDDDEELQELQTSLRGVPNQFAATHSYLANLEYPSELDQELFPLTLDKFESPCAVVMLWNFYQLVKKPPDRRKILLPVGLNRQAPLEDYQALVRPERAALLLRQAIMFYTSGYCMIQSGLKLNKVDREVPSDRGTKIIINPKKTAKKPSKKAQQAKVKTDKSIFRKFNAQQKANLRDLKPKRGVSAKFKNLFKLQSDIVANAAKLTSKELEILVDNLYQLYSSAYGLPLRANTGPKSDLINAIGAARGKAQEMTTLMLRDEEKFLEYLLEPTNKFAWTPTQESMIDARMAQIDARLKAPSLDVASPEAEEKTPNDEDSFIDDEQVFGSEPPDQARPTRLNKRQLANRSAVPYKGDGARVKIARPEATRLNKRQLANRSAVPYKGSGARVKVPPLRKRKATPGDLKGVVTGPSLIVRGFSRVFNLTNMQTVESHEPKRRKNKDANAVMRAVQRCAIFRTPSALKVLGVDSSALDGGPALPCDIFMDKTSAASALLLAYMELADYMFSPSPPLMTRDQLLTVEGYWGDKNIPFGKGDEYKKWGTDRQQAFRDAYRKQMKKWLDVGFQPTGERSENHGMPLMNWDAWAPGDKLFANPWRVREDNYFRMLMTEFPNDMLNRLGIGKTAEQMWSKETDYGYEKAVIRPICKQDPGLYKRGIKMDSVLGNTDADPKSMQYKRARMQSNVSAAINDIAKNFKDRIAPQFGVSYYDTAFRVEPSTQDLYGIKKNPKCKMWGLLKEPLETIKPPALLNVEHHPVTDVALSAAMFKPIPNMPPEWFVYPLNKLDASLVNGQQFRSGVQVTPREPGGGLLTDYDITLRTQPKVWDLTVALKKLVGEDFECRQ